MTRQLPLILLLFALTLGCQSRQPLGYERVEVLFCTDRAIKDDRPLSLGRGTARWGKMAVGVEIEEGEVVSEDRRTDYKGPIHPHGRLNTEQTASELAPGTEILVYIHGYNQTFDEAIAAAAQLRKHLKIDGPVIAFCWPSRGTPIGYMYDVETSVWATPHATEMLRQVLRIAGADKRVHVLCHSLGTRILLSSLSQLALDDDKGRLRAGDGPPYFDQIIMAAPDVDAELFRQTWMKQVRSMAKSFTVYASSRDDALRVSEILHREKRAGEIEAWKKTEGADPTGPLEFDVVDVSHVDTSDFGHLYYNGRVRQVTADMEAVVHLAPQRRLAHPEPDSPVRRIPGYRRTSMEIGN